MVNEYYQKHKKKLRKKCERYQNLSEEEKGKRRKKVRDRYINLPEEKKIKNYAII